MPLNDKRKDMCCATARAGLNEREAPGKVVKARAPTRLAQLRSVSHASSFQLCRAPVKNVKTDTIWQTTFQRQFGVPLYGGSYVLNLFKQKVVSQKSDLFATVTPHNNVSVIDSLTWPSEWGALPTPGF